MYGTIDAVPGSEGFVYDKLLVWRYIIVGCHLLCSRHIPPANLSILPAILHRVTSRASRVLSKMWPLSDSQFSLFVACVFIYVLVTGAWTLYSVYLGPLAKFPGPKLAAASLWYEFYYDVVLRGQYTFKIKELHKQYGMLVVIGPVLALELIVLITDRPNYSDQSL